MASEAEKALLRKTAAELVKSRQAARSLDVKVVIPGECPYCRREVGVWVRIDAIQVSAAVGAKKPSTPGTAHPSNVPA